MHLPRHSAPESIPARWRQLLDDDAAIWRRLGSGDREQLAELTARFASIKEFEPAGGIELDDRITAVIAAHAVVPVLRLGLDAYRDVHSVIVYPSTVVRKGVQASAAGVCHSGATPLLGETMAHGPVLVVWDAALHAARHPEEGRNVVFHEFAHKLDMLTGSADGVPPLPDRSATRRWQQLVDGVLTRIREGAAPDPVLGSYAEVSSAELFAVATEAFFTIPGRMQRLHASLYEALASFYGQDPTSWNGPGD